MEKKSHPYRRLFQIIGSVVSVVSTVLSFVQAFKNQAQYSIILYVISMLSIIGVFLYSIIITIKDYQEKIKDLQESNDKKLLSIAHASHEYAGHLLRDSVFKLENLVGQGIYNDDILLDYLNTFCKQASEHLDSVFEAIYDQSCVVNIRLIDPDLWDNSKIQVDNRTGVKVYSYGRTGEVDAERRRLDEKTYSIQDDTGMQSIFIDQNSDFYQLEISKHQSGDPPVKYLLLDKNKELYDNIFIVPIRIKTHVLEQGLDNVNKNNLFGFISVDFKDAHKIGDKEIKYGLDFLKTFADSSYLYIEHVRRHLHH